MEIKSEQVLKYTSQVGLKINVAKTKLIRLNARPPCVISIQDESLEEVDISYTLAGTEDTKKQFAKFQVWSAIA